MAFMVASGLIPAFHWFYLMYDSEEIYFARGVLLMFLFYFIGFILFHFNLPEKYYRNNAKFDIFGHSHQWWHICVVIAASIWYVYLNQYKQWRIDNNALCD